MATKTARKPKARELVLGKLEVADLLGVTVETVYQWHARKLLPAGDMRVAGADAWYESTIQDWAKETGRWKK